LGRLGKWNENKIAFYGGGHRHSGGAQGRLLQGDSFSTYAIRNAATAGAAATRRQLTKFWWIRGTAVESAGAATVGTVSLGGGTGLFSTIDCIFVIPALTSYHKSGASVFYGGYLTTGPASFVLHGRGAEAGTADVLILGR